MPEISRNKYSVLTSDSGPASISGYPMQPPSQDSGHHPMAGGGFSRSVCLPSRPSRGPSAESERYRAVEAVKQSTRPNGRDHVEVGGPAMSLGPLPAGRPVPDSIGEASLLMEQAKLLKGKSDMKREVIEKKGRNFLDEFLHGGTEKVNNSACF